MFVCKREDAGVASSIRTSGEAVLCGRYQCETVLRFVYPGTDGENMDQDGSKGKKVYHSLNLVFNLTDIVNALDTWII